MQNTPGKTSSAGSTSAAGSPSPSPIAPGDRRSLLPMDPQLKDIQPGGGVVIHLEQAWGRIRRVWLKSFRKSYLKQMLATRRGEFNPCPHEVLDPRDLKFYRNQGGYYWRPEDDPFTWRDRLPFARVGLAELMLMAGGFLGTALVLGVLLAGVAGIQLPESLRIPVGLLAITALVIGILITWFFRNPHRQIPQQPGVVTSPADGTVVDVEEIAHDDFIGGPARKIGIFLSIFNVHINRTPVSGRVIGLKYRPGKYLNALRPESARENEQLAVMIESDEAPFRGFVVRQITGAIARRIVCWLKPGDSLHRGDQFGMIKLGSRTELLMPAEPGLEIRVKPGDKVLAGATIVAVYPNTVTSQNESR